MHTDHYSLIGLMSGTSGDGLDLAYCQFEWLEGWKFEIVEAETIPFPADLGKSSLRLTFFLPWIWRS